MRGTASLSDYPLTGAFLSGRMRHEFSPAMLAEVEAMMGPLRHFSDGERLAEAGPALSTAHLLVEGYMFAVIERDDRRFIVGMFVPGDFVDLHGFVLKRLDHAIIAAGPVKVSPVSHQSLCAATDRSPDIARALWFATLLDAAIHRQWIRNLEALDAPQRIAHLFCELRCRLEAIGRSGGRTVRTPFTQSDLADMCGVSAIHANRAVARLRDLGLGEIRRGTLYTDKWQDLYAFGHFDPGYLYLAP